METPVSPVGILIESRPTRTATNHDRPHPDLPGDLKPGYDGCALARCAVSPPNVFLEPLLGMVVPDNAHGVE